MREDEEGEDEIHAISTIHLKENAQENVGQ